MGLTCAALLAFGFGAGASLRAARRPAMARLLSCGFAALGSALLLLQSLAVLAGLPAPDLVWAGWFPFSDLHLSWLPLSALFCAIIGFLGLTASCHALSYAEEYDHRAAWVGFFYNLFLPAMALVPLAANAFTFLFFWEAMAMASFFLVLTEHHSPKARQAGYLYLVMSHAGTALLFLLFYRLHSAVGSWEFEAFRAAGPLLPPRTKDWLFLLAVAGFGVKAGLAPLHVWLPQAHPEAPSHVSALMSGAMVKTGVYGIILVVVGFLGAGPWWWGGLLLVAAAASALLGVLYALMEHDLKRLLAYHTVENIGIILMGVAVGLLFSSFGRADLAAWALAAGLYHTVNHAVFKGLLFLGAGSVSKACGTKDMERLGGLVKVMPATAACFLVGSLAISAMPPFNGFFSEWLTFQALLAGFGLPAAGARILCLLAAAALAMTGGLAAACFVKAFGLTFLAMPRSDEARRAAEAAWPERLAMAVLALACLALGLCPAPMLGALTSVLPALPSAMAPLPAGSVSGVASAFGAVLPLALLAAAAACAAAAWGLAVAFGGWPSVRRAPTWACGMPGLTPRMEYTATAFSKPFRMLFSFLYQPSREVSQEAALGEYYPTAIRYSSEIRHVILEKLYHPPVRLLLRAAHLTRRLQAGSINLYLGYLLAVLAALLALFLSGRLG